MEHNKRENKISLKNWFLIWIIGMAGQICWNVENAWFSTFVYDKIAKDPAIISWMVGVSAVVTTFCTFIVGTWSDRIGKRKPFVAIGYLLWGVFTVVFGLAEFLPKTPLMLVAVFVVATDAIMSFFGSFGNDAGFSIWTTDISNEHNRGRIAGALAVMPVIATIFGTIVSGMIVDALDFFAFFVIMGVMVFCIGLFALFAMKDAPDLVPRREEKTFWRQLVKVFSWRTVRDNKELFWVFVVMLVYFVGFNVYFSYITIYFVDYLGFNYTNAGILQGGALVLASLTTFLAARYIDRGKLTQVLTVALCANAVGLILIALSTAQTLPSLCIGMFLAGCGYILSLQTLTAWMKNLYPEEQRGQFEGVKQLFFVALPMVFGPMIAAPIINHLGVPMTLDGVTGMVPTPALFYVSAVITSLAALPLIMANRLLQQRKASACESLEA